jgi:predicted RNA binding protein YcfA (HicA-like mRNA interferase family)
MAQITAERMIRALRRLGWEMARQSGSHVVLTRPRRTSLVVPAHRGSALKEGTARGILRQAGVAEDEFFDVY